MVIVLLLIPVSCLSSSHQYLNAPVAPVGMPNELVPLVADRSVYQRIMDKLDCIKLYNKNCPQEQAQQKKIIYI